MLIKAPEFQELEKLFFMNFTLASSHCLLGLWVSVPVESAELIEQVDLTGFAVVSDCSDPT